MSTSQHPVWGKRSADEARACKTKLFDLLSVTKSFLTAFITRKLKSLGIGPSDLRIWRIFPNSRSPVKPTSPSLLPRGESVISSFFQTRKTSPPSRHHTSCPLHRHRKHRMLLDEEYRPILLTSTTGRSAEFRTFSLHPPGYQPPWGDGRKNHAGRQLHPGRPCAQCISYAPHLAYWLTYHAADQAGAFHLGTGGGKTMGTDGNLRLLVKSKPTVLVGMPTFVYHMLRRALEVGESGGLKVIALVAKKHLRSPPKTGRISRGIRLSLIFASSPLMDLRRPRVRGRNVRCLR